MKKIFGFLMATLIFMAIMPTMIQAQGSKSYTVCAIGSVPDTQYTMISVGHAEINGTVNIYIHNTDSTDTLKVALQPSDTVAGRYWPIVATKDWTFEQVRTDQVWLEGSGACSYELKAYGKSHP